MMKYIIVIIAGLTAIWWLVFQLPDVKLGFPTVHPIAADCIGIKYEKIDEYEINRIYCYGFLYNGWLE